MDTSPFYASRPFTHAQLVDAGINPNLLKRRDFQQVVKGVWIHRDHADDPDVLVRAALTLHPRGAFASHLSAAALYGLPVPDHPFAHVTVGRHSDRRFRPGIKPHVTKRRRTVVGVRGIPATDVLTTFIQCAGYLSLVEQVVLGDALVRKFPISAEQLRSACDRSTEYYANAARKAARFVRDRVDSPMETRVRVLLVLAGLPEPTVDHRVYWPDGRLRRRYDLYYECARLLVEYEGRQHAEDIDQWQRDIERREELDDDGQRLLIVTAPGIYVEPEETLRRVRAALLARSSEPVPHIDPRWRRHFGG